MDVKTVDDHVRITRIWLASAGTRNYAAVVVNAGLRSKAADHAYGSHVIGKRFITAAQDSDFKAQSFR